MRWTLLVLLLATSVSQAADRIVFHDFEQNEAGWTAFGSPSGHLRITHEPADVKEGKGALCFDYEASGTAPAIALLPVTRSLESMRSIRLWLMAEKPTAAAIFLSEKEGGRYVAITWLEPRIWQRVELTPDDFALASNANDPKDPDGKLDLDQVHAVGILDISQILNAALAGAGAPIAVVSHAGPQKLLVDDFEMSSETPVWHKTAAPYLIDDFAHPQLSWFTFGGANLKLDDSHKVMPARNLEVAYEQMEEHFALILKTLPAGTDLRGATHLAFDIASEKPANIILTLEEFAPGKNEGPRYSVDLEIPGGGKPAHREVAISAFEKSEQGPEDPNKKLDLDQLKSISLVDVTAAFTQSESVNTLHLGAMQAIKKAEAPSK